MKFKIKKDDIVSILTGNAKGSQGKVLRILKASNRIVVEGINKVKKHVKNDKDGKNGGIVEKEHSIHYSNVKKIVS